MSNTFVGGHSRKQLVSNTVLTVPGSHGLGAANVAGFSRFTGLFSVIGSLTFLYRLGVNSGTYQVSSSFVVNSGGSTFSVLNPGATAADFGFSAANSQAGVVVQIVGEPLA